MTGRSHRRSRPISGAEDTRFFRQISEWLLDAAAARDDDAQVIQKFGVNPSLALGVEEDIWSTGGDITFLTAASAVRIKSGGNSADSVSGNSARKVVVQGLDENWEQAQEEVELAGASASAATTTTFIRVFRSWVSAVGTYGASNAADVIIETTGGTEMARILAGEGQTQYAGYTIPAGWTGYLRGARGTVASNKSCDLYGWFRLNADVTSGDMGAKRLFGFRPGVQGGIGTAFAAYPSFPEKTDIWFSGIPSGNDTAVEIDFDIVLLRNPP